MFDAFCLFREGRVRCERLIAKRTDTTGFYSRRKWRDGCPLEHQSKNLSGTVHCTSNISRCIFIF